MMALERGRYARRSHCICECADRIGNLMLRSWSCGLEELWVVVVSSLSLWSAEIVGLIE